MIPGNTRHVNAENTEGECLDHALLMPDCTFVISLLLGTGNVLFCPYVTVNAMALRDAKKYHSSFRCPNW